MKKILLTLSLLSISLCSATIDELLQDFSQKYKAAQEAGKKAKSASFLTRDKAMRKQMEAEDAFQAANQALVNELAAIEARANELSKTSNPSRKLELAQQLMTDLNNLKKVTEEHSKVLKDAVLKTSELSHITLALTIQLKLTNEAVNAAMTSLKKS